MLPSVLDNCGLRSREFFIPIVQSTGDNCSKAQKLARLRLELDLLDGFDEHDCDATVYARRYRLRKTA